MQRIRLQHGHGTRETKKHRQKNNAEVVSIRNHWRIGA